jgi:hypothetical protein
LLAANNRSKAITTGGASLSELIQPLEAKLERFGVEDAAVDETDFATNLALPRRVPVNVRRLTKNCFSSEKRPSARHDAGPSAQLASTKAAKALTELGEPLSCGTISTAGEQRARAGEHLPGIGCSGRRPPWR